MSAQAKPEYNPRAKAALLLGLENQLGSPETPEVKAELDRLIASGVKMKKAKEMMAAILAFHIARVMKGTQAFDYSLYLDELRQLPEIDFDQPL
jgi:hypothetical protein